MAGESQKARLPHRIENLRDQGTRREWARMVESEMDRGVFVSTAEAEVTTLEDLLRRYEVEVLPTKKSRADVKSRITIISGLIGMYSAAALTSKVLAGFRDERLKQVKGHTVRKELHLIGRVLKQAQREWGINLPRGNPVNSITVPTQPKGRERRLRADEEKKLLESAADYEGEISNIIQFAIESGMRRGEISELRWKDVDLRKCTASLWDTKNGDNRTIPLSPDAMQVLESMPRNINGRVFAMRPDNHSDL